MEIHFAPLQGYTDVVYRNTFNQFFQGLDKFYTPFIRMGKDDLIRKKDMRDIAADSNDTSITIPQFLAKDAHETQLLLSKITEQGYQHADLNLGCPFPMVVRSQRGSGLLAHPKTIKEILDEAFKFKSIQLSVKIRLGLEASNELLQLLPILERYPLQHIAVHARTTKQQYKGIPNKEAFADIYQATQVPLIYNGDLNSIDEMNKTTDQFPKLKGLMLGRGLLQNPLLAQQFKFQSAVVENRTQLFKDFHDHLFDSYQAKLSGDSHLLSKMKTLWDYFLPDMEKKYKKKIAKSKSIESYLLGVREGMSAMDCT